MTLPNFNLTIDQAEHNAEILNLQNVTFTTDKKGNIDYISNFNIMGRFFNWIKNLINGSREHKVNKAILATFNTIKEYAQSHPDSPKWSYNASIYYAKPFRIGFDEVAMRILLDKNRFDSYYYRSPEKESDDTLIKIRKAAYDVMLMATEQRTRRHIGFDEIYF